MASRNVNPVVMMFPVLEAASFVASSVVVATRPWIGAALLLLASLLLCLSVHVSVHEAVHHPRLARFPLAGPIFAVAMGLPFQGYRWHHFNHHRWNNALEDYSSTWRATKDGPRPWPLWRYMLGWPRQLVRSGLAMRAAHAAGEVPAALHRSIRREQATVLLFVGALAAVAPRLALQYVVLVYIGWALIALQNFGQHPPRTYGVDRPTSYYSPLYNLLLFRNGFHAEHHEEPNLPWHDIEPTPSAPIHAPHLLQPFVGERSA
jgi:fatty acid desaturase